MYRQTIKAASILLGVAAAVSCQNQELLPQELSMREEAIMTVNLSGFGQETKSTTAPTAQNDAKLNNLAIFVFRADNSTKDLDASLLVTSDVQKTGNTIKTTTGKKHVYAVANYHETDWSGVKAESDFLALCSDLKYENNGSFTMTGRDTTFTPVSTGQNTLTINMKRLVARICVDKLSIDFSNTSYANEKLNDVKVYVTNVVGKARFSDGFTQPETPKIYNSKKYVEADNSGTALSGAFYDTVGSISSGSGHTTKHYFIAYQNNVAQESDNVRFTRLVIEGKLNGHLYYWPIDINRGAFKGEGSTTDGVLANSTYSYTVCITRPGSDSPDIPVSTAQCSISLNILDWNTNNTVNTEF